MLSCCHAECDSRLSKEVVRRDRGGARRGRRRLRCPPLGAVGIAPATGSGCGSQLARRRGRPALRLRGLAQALWQPPRPPPARSEASRALATSCCGSGRWTPRNRIGLAWNPRSPCLSAGTRSMRRGPERPMSAGPQPARARRTAAPSGADRSGAHRFAQEEIQAVRADGCLVSWWHRESKERGLLPARMRPLYHAQHAFTLQVESSPGRPVAIVRSPGEDLLVRTCAACSRTAPRGVVCCLRAPECAYSPCSVCCAALPSQLRRARARVSSGNTAGARRARSQRCSSERRRRRRRRSERLCNDSWVRSRPCWSLR